MFRREQYKIDFINKKNEDDLFLDSNFIGYDGGHWTAKLKDIALQLNYHSIHHRAQMIVVMRMLGLSVPGIYGPAREEWAAYGMQPPAV